MRVITLGTIFWLIAEANSLSTKILARRSFIASSALVMAPVRTPAVTTPPGLTLPLDSQRVGGIGGGFDIMVGTKDTDVIYPASMSGLWQCERTLTAVEGNAEQAEQSWRDLGGGDGKFVAGKSEVYPIKFVDAPAGTPCTYQFEGEVFSGVVLDRGFEVDRRAQGHSVVAWDALNANTLKFKRKTEGEDDPATELLVVQRRSNLPSPQGFGFDELIGITAAAGGMFGNRPVQRAARVQRRYRRAFASDGSRIVEGIEIVKTYRVLDGVAGVEMPTSTTKSRLVLQRVPSTV